MIVALSGRALVEGHDDVGSDDALGIYHVLRREDMLRTVDVGTELTSFFAQLADTRQRENLEAARIGQNGAVPSVELVQSTGFADDVKTRTQIEVVGVAQYDLRLHLLTQFREMHALHASHRSDGHKDWRLYLAVGSGDDSCTCIACRVAVL